MNKFKTKQLLLGLFLLLMPLVIACGGVAAQSTKTTALCSSFSGTVNQLTCIVRKSESSQVTATDQTVEWNKINVGFACKQVDQIDETTCVEYNGGSLTPQGFIYPFQHCSLTINQSTKIIKCS